MATDTIITGNQHRVLTTMGWLKIGLGAAAASIATVLVIQFLILSTRPELAAFKPLDSYFRSSIFTLIPALGATFVFAWLARNQSQPVNKFLVISGVFLLLSFIPDFALPIANKTMPASLSAATLHLAAGLVTVGMILWGYTRSHDNGN